MTIEQFNDGELLSSVRNKINANDQELHARFTAVKTSLSNQTPPVSLEDMQLIHFDTTPDSTPTNSGSVYWDSAESVQIIANTLS